MQAHSSSTARFSPWSLTLGTVSGIPVRLHISFILLLFWLGLEDASAHQPTVREFIFLVLLFGSVFLHELAHALVAKRFGIKTREIMLYPFGGVASLAGEMKPKAELLVAIAGPLLNIFIAICLAPLIDFNATRWGAPENPLLVRLFEANFVLALFNLIPALPMDGGRILRAALKILKVKNATTLSSRVSQILSFSLGAFALYIGNIILIVISVFVFLSAMQELVLEKAKIGTEGHTVSEVMLDLSNLKSLPHGMAVSDALKIALKSEQDIFPVLYGEQLMGIVSRNEILQQAITQDGEQYVSGIMERDLTAIDINSTLESLSEKLERDNSDPIVVTNNGKFVGLLRRERFFEFIYVQGMRKHREMNSDDSFNENFQI